MSPLSGTFKLSLGAATCTLPHDATPEEIAEAVEEMNKMRNHMLSIEEKFLGLNMSIDLQAEHL